jgi:hypothetical protein
MQIIYIDLRAPRGRSSQLAMIDAAPDSRHRAGRRRQSLALRRHHGGQDANGLNHALRWRGLQHVMVSPVMIGDLAESVLVLTQFEHKMIT